MTTAAPTATGIIGWMTLQPTTIGRRRTDADGCRRYRARRSFIPGIAGAEFLRLDVEVEPFVRHFFIPACALVSRLHEWVSFDPLTILDDVDYEDPEGLPVLTDEQFAARLNG